jgi:hypothetical protein
MKTHLKADHIQFRKVIGRNVPIELNGECRVLVAALGQAWLDAEYVQPEKTYRGMNDDRRNRLAARLAIARDARRYFLEPRLASICLLLELDAQFVRELFIKHHPMANVAQAEQMHWRRHAEPLEEIAA